MRTAPTPIPHAPIPHAPVPPEPPPVPLWEIQNLPLAQSTLLPGDSLPSAPPVLLPAVPAVIPLVAPPSSLQSAPPIASLKPSPDLFADPIDGFRFEEGEDIHLCGCGTGYRLESVEWLRQSMAGRCVHCGAVLTSPPAP